MKRHRSGQRHCIALPTATLLLGLAACSGGGGSSGPGPIDPPPSAGFATSVAFSPVQPVPESDFVVTVSYSINPSTVLLGAYVAEIAFDPALVQFVSADAAMTQGRVLNTLAAQTGSIVVAGANTAGFTDGVLFKGSFRALAPGVSPSNFPLAVREAADNHLSNLLD